MEDTPVQNTARSKTDWSVTEKATPMDRGKLPGGAPPRGTELVPAGSTNTIPALMMALPAAVDQLGILGLWKGKKLGRKAAMRSLDLHYSSQLDELTHRLVQSTRVKKVRADVLAEEFLKELDSKHLAVLTEFGLRNNETRARALIELTEKTASKLREIQEKDWPDALIAETITQLLGLRMRVVAEIMKELGGDHVES